MAGRRLIDAAKLFNASKGIAQQHLKLRSQQLDVFTKTSSLAKAAKNQTDRITLTLEAARVLSQRLNEEAPRYASAAVQRATGAQHADVPTKDSVKGERPREDTKTGLEQDHHYDRSAKNTQAAPPADGELGVRQEEAGQAPLPDGTIPSAGVTLEEGTRGQDTFSERPVPEAPKAPLAEEHRTKPRDDEGMRPVESRASTIPVPGKPAGASSDKIMSVDEMRAQREQFDQIPSHANEPYHPSPAPRVQQLQEGHDRDVFYTRSVESEPTTSSHQSPKTRIPRYGETHQESDFHVRDEQMNQDVYYSVAEPDQEQMQREDIPQRVAVPLQESVPEGINTDVFLTTRYKKMLGGNPYNQKPHMDLKGAARTPLDHTKTAQGHDQDTFNVRRSEESQPSLPEEPLQQSHPAQPTQPTQPGTSEKEMHELASQLAKDAEAAASPASEIPSEVIDEPEKARYELRESRVPSSRFGRIWQYAGLGTSMAFGAVGEGLRRVTGTAAATGGSLMLSPGNLEILVAKLSRMRGAALKLGQIISFQDIKMLPPAIHEVLQRVQDSADYMPAWQRDKVLASNLGSEWRDLFTSFDEKPIAAASIGQVHKAVLKSTGHPVAVKVQYPGVADSIDSDLNNLSILLTASRLLPKGLFLDRTIANARTELAWECDYVREAEWQERFRAAVADDSSVFKVPKTFPEACGPQVLTAELVHGVGVAKLPTLAQEKRDWIGTQILRLCLREIIEFKFMQTDPNWTNFLYNEKDHKIELLDFGASREYAEEFVDPYINVLIAASLNDRNAIRDLSIQLGYLTGAESQPMLDAHIQSVLTLAEPFQESGPEIYDFRDQTITDRVRGLIPVMVRERLAPPPEETYSLHRKLSGAFLLCARLGSRVPCRALFEKAIETYRKGGKITNP
ncbi:ubiquinone biosynthesis protein-like protein coq-8 [Paraphaeosphaeria sporulosa]|uniref:Ubiquinone biosynthesis protein-like protein coq-8 n=1 Tax=Paraphaeosphaeria sporulosa TaxID=1460663 RepID=A0A177CFX6_9PLEO|nr:ubiquinone biosynthesis protein-like protein coq-8 [Paraphaeosphaeria sporulosa]OAG05729.1 ubiquinone biosynthesis protein-like protein coq-8 [Paraphaeosphaeria sporulosa]